jgi:hypothetical protein
MFQFSVIKEKKNGNVIFESVEPVITNASSLGTVDFQWQ